MPATGVSEAQHGDCLGYGHRPRDLFMLLAALIQPSAATHTSSGLQVDDDMFGPGSAAPAAGGAVKKGLLDNYDDVEGYYNFQVRVLPLRSVGNSASMSALPRHRMCSLSQCAMIAPILQSYQLQLAQHCAARDLHLERSRCCLRPNNVSLFSIASVTRLQSITVRMMWYRASKTYLGYRCRWGR